MKKTRRNTKGRGVPNNSEGKEGGKEEKQTFFFFGEK